MSPVAAVEVVEIGSTWTGKERGTLMAPAGIAFSVGGLIIGGFLSLFFYWIFRNERKNRELEHAERMKAIEFGTTLPQDRRMNPGVAIAIWVPLGVFTLALSGSATSNAAAFLWPAAAVVGGIAIICGVILALNQPTPTQIVRSGQNTAPIKPHVVDPDTFDVVGRRG